MAPLEIRCDDHLASAHQMALDERLLAAVASPLLRFYRWVPPAVSCGRGQDPALIADTAALAGRGWGLVRRPTGGGALLHRGDMTFSLLLPPDLAGSPRAAYALAGGIVAATVARLVGAVVDGPAGDRKVGHHPVCFLGGHGGETFMGGGKSAGIALRWTRKGCLVQVSLLLEDNADEAAACLLAPEGMTRDDFANRLREASTPLVALTGSFPPVEEIRRVITEEAERLVAGGSPRSRL
jgi:lipoate-protein ligase A